MTDPLPATTHFRFIRRFAVAFLVILALFVALPLWAEHRAIEQLERQRLHSLTATLVEGVVQQLATIRNTVERLQTDLSNWLQQADGGALAERRLDTLAEAMPGLLAARITDASGQPLAHYQPEMFASSEASDPGSPTAPTVLWLRTALQPDGEATTELRITLSNQLPPAHTQGSIDLVLSRSAFALPLRASRHDDDLHLALLSVDGNALVTLPDDGTGGAVDVLRSVLAALPSAGDDDVTVRFARADAPDVPGTRLAAVGDIDVPQTDSARDLRIVASRSLSALYDRWWLAVQMRTALFALTVLAVLIALLLLRSNLRNQESLRRQALQRDRLFASIFAGTQEGILVTDSAGIIIEVNAAMLRMSGYAREALLGSTPRRLKSDRHESGTYAALWQALTRDGHWEGELWNRRPDGSDYPVLLTITAVRDATGAVQYYAGIMNDISALKEHQAALERFAHQDTLTGLPNRRRLDQRLQQALRRQRHDHEPLALLFIDLDGFKQVNDAHGHEIGDRLLQAVAQRMANELRREDTLARLGGDEFIALLMGASDEHEFRLGAERLLTAVASPFMVDGISLQVSASIGALYVPAEAARRSAPSSAHLLRLADQAMYRAKASGKNRIAVATYVPEPAPTPPASESGTAPSGTAR